jgi:heat shock protein HtpX
VRTWVQTFLGIAFLGALVAVAFKFLGFAWSFGAVVLSVTTILPIISWYFSGPLIKKLTRCAEPDMEDPEHARVVRIVDKLFPKTGLAVKPAVYIAPMPIANAFATGRSPSNALIAVTEGLFFLDLTDDELEAILAHELAHVKNRDIAITSLTAVLGSLFGILLSGGLPRMFNSAFVQKSDSPLLNKLTRKVNNEKKRLFIPAGGFIGFIFMLVIFYFVSIFTKLLSLFVARSRESAADAYAAEWTTNPCALSTALQKLILFEHRNGGNVKLMVITRGLTPILLVNHLAEDGTDESHLSLGGRIRRWWKRLGENHPPVMERIKTLDTMSGGKCERLI